MKKFWTFLAVMALLLVGSVHAQNYGTLTFRADISGPGAFDNAGTWEIIPGADLEINIYGTNAGGTDARITWSSPFLISGTGAVTNVTWGDTATFYTAQFATFWDMYKRTYAEGWDGNLTNDIGNGHIGDLYNYTGVGNNVGYAQGLGEILILKLKLVVASTDNQPGQLCIDEGDATDGVYDWLFDEYTPPYPTFAQVCWPINVSDVKERPGAQLPTEFGLDQNYPNPFNPTTVVNFALPSATHVNITVYNVLGQAIKNLVDKDMTAGYWSATWDGTNDAGHSVASGIYFYKIDAGKFQSTKKMMMLK